MPGLPSSTEAFVTLVTNSEYGLGAAVLGYRLRAVGTTRSTVVMVTESVPDTTRKMLSKTWDTVLDVTQLDSNDSDRLAMLKRPELGITFSKLNVWKLTQYKKVCCSKLLKFVLVNVKILDFQTLLLQNPCTTKSHVSINFGMYARWCL